MKIDVFEIDIADCQRGDILLASDRNLTKGYHPIVFFEHNETENDFTGCMLTHKQIDKNVPMIDSHFSDFSDKFRYDNTQIVKGKFKKFLSWGSFSKVGRLSESGIIFVENLIRDLPLEEFGRYYARTRNRNR